MFQYVLTQMTLFECFINTTWHCVIRKEMCSDIIACRCQEPMNRFLNRFNEPNCPKRTRGRKWIGLHHYCTLVIAMQNNHYCADSDSKRISTVQNRAPSESLLHRLKLQMNHYCTDSSSKWITTVQTHTPNESLLHRLKLQMNHYCADSYFKLITTAQIRAPN